MPKQVFKQHSDVGLPVEAHFGEGIPKALGPFYKTAAGVVVPSHRPETGETIGYRVYTKSGTSTHTRLHELQHAYYGAPDRSDKIIGRAKMLYRHAEDELLAEMGAMQGMGRAVTYKTLLHQPYLRLRSDDASDKEILQVLTQLAEVYEIPLPRELVLELQERTKGIKGKPLMRFLRGEY